MTAWWCAHAWLPEGPARAVRLVAGADGTFASVTPGVAAAPGDTRLPGLVLPGLADAHSHAFHRALRGRTSGGAGDFWTWRRAMYAVAERLDPDGLLELATLAYAEQALAGFASVAEFHYLHHGPRGVPYDDPNAMAGALREAARRAGVRLTLLDACYLTGGIGRPLEGVQDRFGDGSAAGWAQRVGALGEDEAFRVGAAVHSVRAVPADQIATVAAARPHRPLHAHVAEQPAEPVTGFCILPRVATMSRTDARNAAPSM